MSTFLSLYNEIEYKIKQISVRYNEQKEENEELKKTVNLLTQQVDELTKRTEELDEKLKLVTITKTILKKEDKKDIKKKINDLVREIDDCIGLLNSE
ncbi:MAG TPA: hypothetical protein PLB66_02390 [Bacteroidales bacterium]|jgi:chromosome segregation ATPase|nr:hypothetical protein [Bacteroidales bacterium]HPY80299.1 hypothetical protein [Bacteroidales bacterium]HQA86781.1 hypothetical protein [Bacteroidales bacterium]